MRIAAITAHDDGRRYTITLQSIRSPLTAIYGPAQSGKTSVADLVNHALFGKLPATAIAVPDGELVVEDGKNRYRIRRSCDQHGQARLTVAALDHASGGARSPIDRHTIRNLVGNLSPNVLIPLCAVSFTEAPDIGRLLSPEFVSGFHQLAGIGEAHATRRVSELAARRDLLAQELETRIAAERRASKSLEARWRELDRLVRDEQQQTASAEQRLKAVENSLAETDARLRYRRIELNVELRWQTPETPDTERPAELDTQIARSRQMLSELNERECAARAKLAQMQTATRSNSAAVLADQQAWIAVSRQLAADLTGEVARLARASASQQCVCRDAHPRLRPIAETIERQLAVLEKSVDEQRQAIGATELTIEVDNLTRAQAELRRHLEHLLDCSQSQLRVTALARQDGGSPMTVYSAADAEQLESRRLELEQERFRLAELVNSAAKKLKVLRAERDAVERERAALLSARSIEHVQRELAHVQKKLEEASHGGDNAGDVAAIEYLDQASDYLAQLTNGDIRRLMLFNQGRNAVVVSNAGETISLDLLTAGQRGQVYLSLCLALLSAASRRGVWLPLVLDEPFERLDARGTAALAAVLDGFSRQGHQILVFTRQKEVAERFASIGADTRDMMELRQSPEDVLPNVAPELRPTRITPKKVVKKCDGDEQMELRRRKKRITNRGDEADEAERSDAA
jgi:hypothetical protein